jgi:hypothetical protein
MIDRHRPVSAAIAVACRTYIWLGGKSRFALGVQGLAKTGVAPPYMHGIHPLRENSSRSL